MVEFALSSLIIFGVLYAGLRLGLIGLEQIKGDGAAFTGAHLAALPTPGAANPNTIVPQTYPGVTSANMTFSPAPLPSSTASEPVDYDLAQSNSRHGGFSVVVPTQTVANVARPMVDNLVLGLTGSAFTLNGMAVEPDFQEIGVHGNVGGTALNDPAAFAGRVNYYTEGENTPPYFAGFKFMHYCTDVTSTDFTSCVPASPTYAPFQLRGLGLAEFLDTDNWGLTKNGVTSGAVFGDTLMHQQVFAAVAAQIASATGGSANPTSDVVYGAMSTLATYLDPARGATMKCIFSWDEPHIGLETTGPIGAYPLYPGNPCT